jgi:hypothetical protein
MTGIAGIVGVALVIFGFGIALRGNVRRGILQNAVSAVRNEGIARPPGFLLSAAGIRHGQLLCARGGG